MKMSEAKYITKELAERGYDSEISGGTFEKCVSAELDGKVLATWCNYPEALSGAAKLEVLN